MADLASAVDDTVEALLRQVLNDKNTAALAVPGGSTARLVMPKLAARALPWHRLHITLVDERWVSPSDPNSNEGLVRSLLGERANLAMTGLTAGGSPDAALQLANGRVPEPDVALLGMGEDGHIASLFPHDPANFARDRFAVVTRPDFMRITMTAQALQRVPHIVLAFYGSAKRTVFEQAREPGPAEEIPVRHILAQAHVLTAD